MYSADNQYEKGKPADEGSHPIRLAGSTLGHRAHICAFFNGPEDADRVLLPFIKEGLECGEKTVRTIDPRRRDEHLQRMVSAGIDVAGFRERGQLELRDWANTHLLHGCFDSHRTLSLFEKIVKEGKQKGFPLIRFVTHMEWVLETELDLDDLLEYEAKANDVWLQQDGPVNPVVCAYDLRRFRGDIVVDVMRTHPLVIVGGILQENPFFVPPEELLGRLKEKERTHDRITASGVRLS